MQSINANKFAPSDITFRTPASETPVLVTPLDLGINPNEVPDLDFLIRKKALIRKHIGEFGAMVLRGFNSIGNDAFESLLTQLDYNLMDNNTGGASPRPRIKGKVFVSTVAPKPFIIGFHTEFVYQNKRPGVISFSCQKAPKTFGETPIFDCARVFERLTPELQQKLEDLGVQYHRRFYGGKSLINFRKTWSDVFETTDKSTVEKFLVAEGMEFIWDKDDNLVTQHRMPAVLKDPQTGEKLLSITMFNGESFAYNFWHFQERYGMVKRAILDYFVHRETQEGRRFLYVAWGDGTPFSRQESEQIQRAAWDCALIFKWQQNDILLLNNKRWAHARLNVSDERNIIVAMGDQYDIRTSDYLSV